METIGAFQAKTQFSELLDRVEQGEEVTITRHGQVVAKLVPAEKPASRDDVVARIVALSEKIKVHNRGKPLVTQEEIRAWRHEGHKY